MSYLNEIQYTILMCHELECAASGQYFVEVDIAGMTQSLA